MRDAGTPPKRGGGLTLTLEGAVVLPENRNLDLVALDDALNELAKLDPQQCRIVELRFFGGLSIEETSHVGRFECDSEETLDDRKNLVARRNQQSCAS
jgi:hypothetical protein